MSCATQKSEEWREEADVSEDESSSDGSDSENSDDEEEEEEDVEDPVDEIRAGCQDDKHCEEAKHHYDKCTARVNSKKNTTESCEEEFHHFVHCVEHCVASKLFAKLK